MLPSFSVRSGSRAVSNTNRCTSARPNPSPAIVRALAIDCALRASMASRASTKGSAPVTPPLAVSAPICPTSGEALTPAHQMIVSASIDVSPAITRWLSTPFTGAFSITSTPIFSSVSLV